MRFIAKLLPNSTIVSGIFDTQTKTFLINPKNPANPRPFSFANTTNLNKAVAEANRAHVEETVQGDPLPAKAKGGNRKKATPEPTKELTTAEKRAAGLAKARAVRAAKLAEQKDAGRVAA